MKRIFCICVLCLILAVCTSCENKEVEVTPTPTPEVTETPNVDYELKGDFLEEYSEIDVVDEVKFLGTAVVKLRPSEYQTKDIPIISESQDNSDLIFTLLHMQPEYFEEYILSASLNNTRAYTFAIMKVNMGYEEAVFNAIQLRINDLESTMKDYPDQLYLIDNFVLEQRGSYLIFIICDNQDKVLDELTEVMGNTDLTTIEEVPFLTEEERKEIENKYLNEEILKIEENINDVNITPIEENENLEFN